MLDPLLAVGGQSFGLRTPRATYEDLYVPVFGRYAARNAAAGVVAFEALTGARARRGRAPRGARCAAHPRPARGGRRTNPPIVLDGAHNPAGAEALAEALARVLPVGAAARRARREREQGRRGGRAPLAAIADVVHATRNDSVRSAEPEEVARRRGPRASADVEVWPSVADAMAAARAAAGPGDLVLVTGSLFTVGDAKRVLARA